MMASNKFETFAEFVKAVRDASESPVVDARSRFSEKFVWWLVNWIALVHPEKIDQVIGIIYHADEAVNHDSE